MNLLLAYATRKGSTQQTMELLGNRLALEGFDVVVQDCDQVTTVEPFDGIVLATAIYKGMWLPAAQTMLRRLKDQIGDKPLAVMVFCIRLLEPAGYAHVMNEYMPQDLLASFNIIGLEAFAGKLRATDIEWHERWTLAIRYDGEWDPNQEFNEDYRDWAKINRWIDMIAEQFKQTS